MKPATCFIKNCTHKPIWHVTVATTGGLLDRDYCQNHLAEFVAMMGDDVYSVEMDRN